MFSLFTSYFTNYKKYSGYYLLACDGSDINISHNPNDKTTYHINTSATRGYNQLHLNALYDVLNGIYADVNIDTAAKTHECGATICSSVLQMPHKRSQQPVDQVQRLNPIV